MALFFAIMYLMFVAFIPFPGWTLVSDQTQWLVLDPQSHTLGSHDGLASAGDNLRWHQRRGYNVVGVTEHNDPTGSYGALDVASKEDLPQVIAGVEISDQKDRFLLALGLNGKDAPFPYGGNERDYARRFIDDVHQRHGGVVIAMAWHLKVEDVAELVAAGIDGFEIANTAHPDIPDVVHQALLKAQQQHSVTLLASSDWHGWGGIARHWTLIRRSAEDPRRGPAIGLGLS